MEKLNRNDLMKYIRENDSAYSKATFELYEDEELGLIKKRIDIEKEKQNQINVSLKELKGNE